MTAGEEQAQPAPTAIVVEALTNGLFRLRMQDGRVLTAHVAKEFRMAFSRLLPGDTVQLDVSPFDPNKARICKLLDRQ
ncbi:MAG: translation initiation factor IF-1 [Planctomycetes bacterium]|nr:translation initiation factor IF-1 [Planctomycetota bacterium]